MASQAGQTGEGGSMVGTVGFPRSGRGGPMPRSPVAACAPGWGGFRTLLCVGRIASQFGGTGSSDKENRFSNCLHPMSCSNQESGERALSPFQPHCLCLSVCVCVSLPLASVFCLSAPLLWASCHRLGGVCLWKMSPRGGRRGCFPPHSHHFQKTRSGGLSHRGSWERCGSRASPRQGCA